MSLPDFLRGVRPNPEVPVSIEVALGLREPIEWRSEPAFAPAIAAAEAALDAALDALNPELPSTDRSGEGLLRLRWPFHIDAQGGELAVEWWGPRGNPRFAPETPVRMALVHGDEATELVTRYGRSAVTAALRREVRRAGLWDWWITDEPDRLVRWTGAWVSEPSGPARLALDVARSLGPLLSPVRRDEGAAAVLAAGLIVAAPAPPGRECLAVLRLKAAIEDLGGPGGPLESSAEDAARLGLRRAVQAVLAGVVEGNGAEAERWLGMALDEAMRAVLAEEAAARRRDYARLVRRHIPFAALVAGMF